MPEKPKEPNIFKPLSPLLSSLRSGKTPTWQEEHEYAVKMQAYAVELQASSQRYQNELEVYQEELIAYNDALNRKEQEQIKYDNLKKSYMLYIVISVSVLGFFSLTSFILAFFISKKEKKSASLNNPDQREK